MQFLHPERNDPFLSEVPSRPGYADKYPRLGNGYSDLPLESKPATIVDYWALLSLHKGLLIAATILGAVFALLCTLPQQPRYRARTAIEIQNVNNDFLNSKEVNPVAEDTSSSSEAIDVQTQITILQSEHLIDEVIEELRAKGKWPASEIASSRLADLKRWLHLPVATSNSATTVSNADLAVLAVKNLTVKQVGQTRVVEIYYTAGNPKLAADFVDTLASTYIEDSLEARWKMSARTGKWLSLQLNEMRAKLQQSEDAMQTYARKSGLLFAASGLNGSAEKTNISDEKLHQLQDSLSRAEADRALAQSKYEIAQTTPPGGLPDVLNDESLRSLQEKLTDLRRQEAELLTTFTSKHEKVQRVEAQIAPLEAAFQAQRAAILGRIQSEFKAASLREQLLRQDYEAQSRVVNDQADRSIQYNILKREVDSNRQIFESMLQQVRQAAVASTIRASNVRVVDNAKAPLLPYSPNLPLNCVLGAVIGLMAGIGMAFFRERGNETLRVPGDSEFWTKVPELGVIPNVALRRPRYSLGREQSKPRFVIGSELQDNLPVRAGRSDAASQRQLMAIAESFRSTATSIVFSGENTGQCRLLVFTSANPMEGKTTLVSNIAIALAEFGMRVLILDADLRKPRMHDLFSIPNDVGFGTLLKQGQLSLDSVSSCIRKTSISGLSVMPSGPAVMAPASLLHSATLKELLLRVKSQFDIVLIDTPPVLGMADARIIGRCADGVIFVTRSERTTREAALTARQRFADDRTRVMGVILNDWNPATSPSAYYGQYKRAYRGYETYVSGNAVK